MKNQHQHRERLLKSYTPVGDNDPEEIISLYEKLTGMEIHSTDKVFDDDVVCFYDGKLGIWMRLRGCGDQLLPLPELRALAEGEGKDESKGVKISAKEFVKSKGIHTKACHDTEENGVLLLVDLLEEYDQEQSELLSQEPKETDKGGWISVEAELPQEHTDWLVYYILNPKSEHFSDSKFMTESSFYNGKWEIEKNGSIVTHYRELPESPSHSD